MKTLIYSTKDFEIPYLEKANANTHELHFTSERLTTHTAMLAVGFEAISIFSADDASPIVLEKLKDFGVSYITLRSAGYDNVSMYKAQKLGMQVANAPDYSPHAIAEHAIALLLAINRKIIRANTQVQQYDFTLSNLIGMDLKGKTIGVIGTGRIGAVIVKILHGFETTIMATDIVESEDLVRDFGVTYMPLQELCKQSDVILLSVPLNTETHHLINAETLSYMKSNAYLINVSRGAIVDTKAVLESLDTHTLNGYATDVYAHESGVFFYDRSSDKPVDPLLDKILTHPKIILTPHQAFATQEALSNIATTTITNLSSWEAGGRSKNELS